jgi:hypothetical protein
MRRAQAQVLSLVPFSWPTEGFNVPRYPLPSQFHGGPWGFGPFLVNTERPKHAAVIGECTLTWSYVMHQMALLLGVLIGGDSEAAAAIFSTLQNARTRRDVLRAAADVRLTDRRRELLDAIAVVVASTEKERNSLVHGVFGVSAALPDSVLWLDSKHMAIWDLGTSLKDAITAADHQELATHIFVYDLDHLLEVQKLIRTTWLTVTELFQYIHYKAPIPGVTDDARFHQICNLPLIAPALAQIRSGKKNNR